MGIGVSKQHITQSITNDIVLKSSNYCKIEGTNNLNGDTIIINGGEGSVTIGGSLSMDDSECSLGSSLTSVVENILKTAASQESTTIGLDILNFKAQDIDINTTIANSISESSAQSCVITGTSTLDNNYIFVQDRDGAIVIGSTTQISDSSCNIESAVSSNTSSASSSSSTQTQTTVGPLAIFGIVIALVIGGVIIVLLMGGIPMPQGGQPVEPKSATSGQTAQAEEIVAENPELLLA